MRAEKFDFRNKEGQQLAALRDRPDWPITSRARSTPRRGRAPHGNCRQMPGWKLSTNARCTGR